MTMKRLSLFISIIIMAAMSASAQISKVFDKYDDREDVVTVYVSGSMIGKMSDNINVNGVKVSSGKIDFLRTLSTENKSLIPTLNSDIKQAIAKTDYTQLVKVGNGNNKTDIYISRIDGDKKEYVIYVHDPKSLCLIQIVGRLNPEDLKLNSDNISTGSGN